MFHWLALGLALGARGFALGARGFLDTNRLVYQYTQRETLALGRQGFPQDKIIAGRSVFIAGHMAMSGLIFSMYLNIFLTTYWPLKLVDQELKPVDTAGFKGLGKTQGV